ncbi:hypothetical protein [Indiicoccus explosivorum]|uniref:hypothetical protein n=1 Tax=Indiicoccus explosivorum TaxID=1917864 RepID=UPI000B44A906|nr:hypothetical protein [Indiicoccus explosivorum]
MKNITKLIRPVIAVLLGVMALQFFVESADEAGIAETLLLAGASLYLLEVKKSTRRSSFWQH